MASSTHYHDFKSVIQKASPPKSSLSLGESTHDNGSIGTETTSTGQAKSPEPPTPEPSVLTPHFEDRTSFVDQNARYHRHRTNKVLLVRSLRNLVTEAWLNNGIRPPSDFLPDGNLLAPYTLVAMIVSDLRAELTSEKSSGELQESIERTLNETLRCAAMQFESIGYTMIEWTSAIKRQQRLIKKGTVSFTELGHLFLPGELIFVETPAPERFKLLGEFQKVEGCTLTKIGTREGLMVQGIQWEWDYNSSHYHIVPRWTFIDVYFGRKRISRSEMGIVPVTALNESDPGDLKKMVVSRGKKYHELFKSKASAWQYTGPAWRYTKDGLDLFDSWEFPPEHARSARHDSSGKCNININSKVVVDASINGLRNGVASHVMHPDAHPTSWPIKDQVLLLFSAQASAYQLPSFASLRVYIELLEKIPDSHDNSAYLAKGGDRLLTAVNNFASWTYDIDEERRQTTGLIVAIQSSSSTARAMAEAVATCVQRNLLEYDLLDLQSETDDPFKIFMPLSKLAVSLSAVLLLRNFEPLITQRSFDEPRRCRQVTVFLDTIQDLPLIIVFCLSKEVNTDLKFEELSPIHLNLD